MKNFSFTALFFTATAQHTNQTYTYNNNLPCSDKTPLRHTMQGTLVDQPPDANGIFHKQRKRSDIILFSGKNYLALFTTTHTQTKESLKKSAKCGVQNQQSTNFQLKQKQTPIQPNEAKQTSTLTTNTNY